MISKRVISHTAQAYLKDGYGIYPAFDLDSGSVVFLSDPLVTFVDGGRFFEATQNGDTFFVREDEIEQGVETSPTVIVGDPGDPTYLGPEYDPSQLQQKKGATLVILSIVVALLIGCGGKGPKIDWGKIARCTGQAAVSLYQCVTGSPDVTPGN